MNKKIGSIIVCMLMAVSLVNTNINSVNAEDNANQPTVQNDGISKCGDDAYYQVDYTSEGIVLTITGTGAIREKAFENWTDLKKVIIKEGITSIGINAFTKSGLQYVEIPDTVTTIGENAFALTNLRNIKIPNTVTSINSGVFYNCVWLRSVTIPDSVQGIGEKAFAFCNNLKTIVVPKSVTSIVDDAFPESTTLIVEKGSKASEYAEKNGYSYVTISLDSSEKTMKIGETSQLIATVANQDGTLNNDNVTWSSNNKNVATVKNGLVTAKAKGKATITATSSQGAQATCVITVEALSIEKTNITLSKDSYEYTGKGIQPTVTVKNGNTVLKEGIDYTLTYKNNVQVGTAQVIVTGIGNYEGTITKTFTIQSKVIVSPSDKDDVQIDVDQKVDGYGDLSDETQATIQESTKDFLEKNYSKEFNALPSGSKIETDVSIKPLDESQLTQEQKDKIKKSLKNGASVLAYYDISVLASAYTKEGNVISGLNNVAVTQLDKPIQISITIPNEYMKANRKFGILRLHNGQVAELTSSVKDNVITFETDCFSIYALTGEDVKEKVNTSDSLSTTLPLIAMGISAMLVVGLYVTRKKKA